MVQNVQNTKTQQNMKGIIKLNNQKTNRHQSSKEEKDYFNTTFSSHVSLKLEAQSLKDWLLLEHPEQMTP